MGSRGPTIAQHLTLVALKKGAVLKRYPRTGRHVVTFPDGRTEHDVSHLTLSALKKKNLVVWNEAQEGYVLAESAERT